MTEFEEKVITGIANLMEDGAQTRDKLEALRGQLETMLSGLGTDISKVRGAVGAYGPKPTVVPPSGVHHE
jgi:hypothetical protein